MITSSYDFDVAIIGGGPGGSTLGALLKKYRPDFRVLILEKEKFPRDHIGESQLPPISRILEEMGCWDAVEAADFPIKVGATFRWGSRKDLWDFEFLPLKDFKDEPRPAKYAGQRLHTAFQVDRSVYDKILLDHAASLGCDVREQTQVTDVPATGDHVDGLLLKDGSRVTARWYIDATGHIGLLRRKLNVPVDLVTSLQNIAIWKYYQNAEWAINIGVGGTRIQIMSQSDGWLWFIPLSPTRSSLGFVCPAEHYKSLGLTPEQVFQDAVARDDRIAPLVANATPEPEIYTTKDWSFCADRTFGENWFLVGEAAGFADPILSAGLTLTHTGARELAYTIIALDEQSHDPNWLRHHYDLNQRARVRQHIRFADFWYAANGQFTDLKENCAKIASDSGLKLSPDAAWRWLAQGGFANDFAGQAGIGGFDLAGAKQITQILTDKDVKWKISESNVFKMNLVGADHEKVPLYENGRIRPVECYVRDGHRLVLVGHYQLLAEILKKTSDAATIYQSLIASFASRVPELHARVLAKHALNSLEVLLSEGWINASLDKKRPLLNVTTPREGAFIHASQPVQPKPAH
ncbi:MAG TPA: NAD(P)/FAD-dependent oxidoreductase [Phycisphaerales bacterium]|nr:NAD(P)/FAD-dependent oxidoreductase [Phycisphaerales bacterium]